ncbi:MAG: hydroxymethylbilane synthase [Deltaproteobacteria bacterium]|nr:hydroxymethylbilane synthase [Deltaproteobacteria bacterium]
MILRIGTRGSKLALAQSEWVRDQIVSRNPDTQVELVQIKTKGDKILDSPLSRIGGKGLFVKEIEEALLKKEVDLAVHSIKDVPAELPEGLCITVYPKREDPRDAFVSLRYQHPSKLPQGAIVGTGSLRRSAQLLALRSDLRIVAMRGNVDTRLRRLESEDLHGLILASAGLNRLGLSSRIGSLLSPDELLPAIGQGALGLEMREDDADLYGMLSFLNDRTTEVTIRAERAFLKKLEGGCQVPIAGYAQLDGNALHLQGMVAELDGSKIIKDKMIGAQNYPEEIGIKLAERVLSSGADKILARVYGRE